MHYGLRSGETICRRIAQVVEALGLDKRLWLNALKSVAKKADGNDETTIRLTENGVLTLFKHFGSLIRESKISGLRLEILSDFGSRLHSLYQWLLKTPVNLTGAEFDVHARALLGIPFVQIFGTDFVTPTIKQIAVYTGYFVDKAREDGESSGQSLSLRNFGDSLMETAHKTTKVGPICYGGGKKGPSTEKEYQESLLAQQMANCALHIVNKEAIQATSSSEKVRRQLRFKEQMKETSSVKCHNKSFSTIICQYLLEHYKL